MSSEWKPALDALIGARHGGRIEHLAPALRDLDRRHPNVPEIAAELGYTLAAQGALVEALAAYERALALGLPSPAEQANTLVGHAVCLLRLDRPADAARALEAARTQFPDHAEFTAYLAVAQHRAGATTDAFALLLGLLLETSEDLGLAAHQRTLRALLAPPSSAAVARV
jgi:thioredoxin-like negative regulator of GroEL